MKEFPNNKIIFDKYKIEKIIGKGSFGSVYKGKNIITNELVALKTEDYKLKGDVLESEAYFLFYLKNFGIPEIKSFGVYKKYKILVQTLLGKNLDDLFFEKRNLNAKDICMIFIQLLDRLEFIHSKYVIHRDLKPENIMLDLETKRIIYLIDFGMAKKYRSGKTKKHVKFSIPSRLTGTARYCSINALRGAEQSRRDDLESAGYVMIYLALRRYLPWIGLRSMKKLERYRQIYKMKKEISEKKLCQGLPNEFVEYMKYTKKLGFEEDPNYNYLRGLFINLLNKYNFKNDFNFSWISLKGQKSVQIFIQRNNLNKRKLSPGQKIVRQIQNSQEKENKIENIKKEKIINILEEKQEKRDNDALKLNIKKEIKETPNKIKNIAVIKNEENLQSSPSFYLGNKDKSNNESIKENKNGHDNLTQMAELNLPISVDESEKGNKKNENENNINDNNNKNININNTNIFSFNNSIKEINEILNNKNKLINNKEKNNQISNSNKNILEPIKNLITNTSPNNLINKSNANINMNSGKVINIIYNNNEQIRYKNDLPNKIENSRKIRPYQRQNRNNQIHNIKIKNMIVGRKTQLKKIILNDKIKMDEYFINEITNSDSNKIKENKQNINHTYFNEKNDEKTLNTYFSYNSVILNKKNSKRNVINFNKDSIKSARSAKNNVTKIFPSIQGINNNINSSINTNNPSLFISNSLKQISSTPERYNKRFFKNPPIRIKNFSSKKIPNPSRSPNFNNKNININDNKIFKNLILNNNYLRKNKNNIKINNNLQKMKFIPNNLKRINLNYNNNNDFNNTYNYTYNYSNKIKNIHPIHINNNVYQGLKTIKINKKKLQDISINNNNKYPNVKRNKISLKKIFSKEYLIYNKIDNKNINNSNNAITDI